MTSNKRTKPKGRNKGGKYERDVCKQLSLWWTNGKRDDVFWRTASSGGMATNRAKQKKKTFGQGGDMQAIDPCGQPFIELFTVEIKRGYRTAEIDAILDKPHVTNLLETFFEQASEAAYQAKAVSWAVILRRDHRQPIIFTPYKLIRHCVTLGSVILKSRHAKIKLLMTSHKSGERTWHTIFVCSLDHFLRTVSRKNIETLYDDSRRRDHKK